jgi:hypothetical protein
MVLAEANCMAVEAKWTEPPYPTVSDWMKPLGTGEERNRRSENRRKVFAGWLELLQPFATRTLTTEDVASVTYQTVHRAASACATAARPQLSYLQFVSEHYGDADVCDERMADLRRLRDALGRPDGFPFRLIEIDIKSTPEFERLAMLPKGSAQTAIAMRHALIFRTLFTFEAIRMHLLP